MVTPRHQRLAKHDPNEKQVVGYADIMEMLTNYDYTTDYTNDAGGAAETWGTEAGHGVISAGQMLAWVEANCGAACSGKTQTVSTSERFEETCTSCKSKTRRSTANFSETFGR